MYCVLYSLPGMTYAEIVDTILRKGDIQVSAAERKHQITSKHQELIEFIHNNYTDSGSKAAISVGELSEWFNKIHHKFSVGGDNFNKSLDILAEDAVSAILSVGAASAPKLHKSTIVAEIYVPVSEAGKAEGEIRNYSTVVSERDEVDRYFYTVEILPGRVDELKNKLNQITKGNTGFTTKSINNEVCIQHS